MSFELLFSNTDPDKQDFNCFTAFKRSDTTDRLKCLRRIMTTYRSLINLSTTQSSLFLVVHYPSW